MKFDPTKPVQTRDGRAARILCTDRLTMSDYPIVALINDGENQERLITFTAKGRQCTDTSPSTSDLVNIPETFTITRWVNVNKNVAGALYLGVWATRKDADNNASQAQRIACLEEVVSGKVGDGL